MVITAGNFVVPLLCDKIALVEQYSPSTTIILALLRFVRKRLCHMHLICLFVMLEKKNLISRSKPISSYHKYTMRYDKLQQMWKFLL